MVIARTLDGEIGLLTGHAPVIGILVRGQHGPDPARGRAAADVFAAVAGGFLSMADNRVSILARQAQLGPDVDTAAAQAALDQAIQDAGPAAAARGASRRPLLPGAAAGRRPGSLTELATGGAPSGSVGPAGARRWLGSLLAARGRWPCSRALGLALRRRILLGRTGGIVECGLRASAGGRLAPWAWPSTSATQLYWFSALRPAASGRTTPSTAAR